MTDDRSQQKDQGLSSLSVDPDLLARELAAEDDVDPLDAIQLDDAEQDSSLEIARACDQGLVLLRGNHGERLQGLQVFCEHRDPRSIALLLPLLQNSCPVERMSAVYALGRNPSPPAVEPLLQLLQHDANAYVRKAAAWSLGNFPRCSGAQSVDPGAADGCRSGAPLVSGIPGGSRQPFPGQGRPRSGAIAGESAH